MFEPEDLEGLLSKVDLCDDESKRYAHVFLAYYDIPKVGSDEQDYSPKLKFDSFVSFPNIAEGVSQLLTLAIGDDDPEDKKRVEKAIDVITNKGYSSLEGLLLRRRFAGSHVSGPFLVHYYDELSWEQLESLLNSMSKERLNQFLQQAEI